MQNAVFYVSSIPLTYTFDTIGNHHWMHEILITPEQTRKITNCKCNQINICYRQTFRSFQITHFWCVEPLANVIKML